jgi:hypothetical protein
VNAIVDRLDSMRPSGGLTEERKREIVDAGRKQDLRELMKMPQFKRFLHRALTEFGIDRSVMTGNSNTYHLVGQQDAARTLRQWVADEVDEGQALDLQHSKHGDEYYVRD